MKKNRLINKILFICVTLLTTIISCALSLKAYGAFNSDDRIVQTEIQKVTNELFGYTSIKSSEYLYNLDDSPDFICVEFDDYGYAIYSSQTLDVLEYSLSGKIPYDMQSKKYYTGPTGYHKRVGQNFENIYTGETITVLESVKFARQAREILTLAQTKKGQTRKTNRKNANTSSIDFAENGTVYSSAPESSQSTNSPSSGDKRIPGGGLGFGTTYITNAEYFTTGPYHGHNSNGTCSAVSAQLLLSYNNYYNDRRIIANNYLFNGEDGPNTCANPISMTSMTLGTRGLNEDGNDDTNSYFHKVVSKIPASSGSIAKVLGIRSLLNERRNLLGLTYDLAEVSWGFDISTIKSEIDSDRPIIINMHVSSSSNHSVIGYGYQTLGGSGTSEDSQFGYIVHCGWAGSSDWTHYSNVWINRAWCYSWEKMVVTHSTHTYGDSSGPYYERMCTTCGHRTTDFPFSTAILDGQVTITGSDFTLPDEFTIPSVISGNRVTGIAASAFAGHDNIKNVKIPNSVQSIGEGAFSRCGSLTSMTIPFAGASRTATGNTSYLGYIFGSLSYLGGDYTRQNEITYYIPASLESITITDSESIKAHTFDNCRNLSKIVLPYGTRSIGNNSFSGCSRLWNFEIPRTVLSIGKNAFTDCNNFISLTIPYSVMSIGENTFPSGKKITWIYNPSHTAASLGLTDHLSNVEVQSGVLSIGQDAFTNCTYLDTVILYEGVASIASNAFDGCRLSTVKWYYNSNYTVASLGGGLAGFLTDVVVPFGMKNIKASAFKNCTKLRSVEIYEDFNNLGRNAFEGCTSLTSLKWNYNPNVTATSIGIQNYLTSVKILDDVDGTTVKSINDSAFSQCNKLTKVEWNYKETSIGSNAFNGCTSLTDIDIPQTMTTVGENAFANCNNLKCIIIPESISYLGASVFNGSDVVIFAEAKSKPSGWNMSWNSSNRPVYWDTNKEKLVKYPSAYYVILDDYAILARYTGTSSSFTFTIAITANGTTFHVKKIGDSAFSNCTSLSGVGISSVVIEMGSNAFRGCTSLASLSVPGSITNIYTSTNSSIEGISLDFVSSCTMINLAIPAYIGGNEINSIGAYSFANQSQLSQIEIPANVKSIGENAFFNSSLETVKFESGSNLTTIGKGAFEDCEKLNKIDIPNGVTTIGERAFKNTNLLNCTIPYTVIYVGVAAFAVNNDDLSITWNYNSFLKATNFSDYLTKVLITENISSISSAAFMNCLKLTQVNIPNTVTSIGENAFYNCSSLVNIVLPSHLTSISESLFYGCSSITNLNIPNKVSSIGAYAFAGCSSITYLNIPDSVLSLGESAFQNCVGLQNIILPSYLSSINGGTFWNCTSLTNITLPSTLEVIGLHAFVNCTSLTNIIIPDTVTELQTEAFYGCSNLTSVTIGSGVKTIGNFAFMYCSSLNMINIPDNIESIFGYAFYGCTELRTVYIQNDSQIITTLGEYVFDSCHSQLSILVPKERFIEYRNGTNWINYSSRIYSMTALLEYGLDCHADSNYSVSLEASEYELFVLHVECAGYYRFTAISASVVQMLFYNESLNLINPIPVLQYEGSKGYFQRNLVAGVYYFKLEYSSSKSSGIVKLSIESPDIEQIWVGSNKNVLTHLHDGYNEYIFNNNYVAQFISFTLTATKNGTITYPQGSITLKSQSGSVLQKVNLNDLSDFSNIDLDGFINIAQNVDGSNSITLLLPYTGGFIIEIRYHEHQVTSLTLNLSTIESYTDDLFLLNETIDTEISRFGSVSRGDEIKQINFLQTGRLNFSVQGLPNAFFVILREVMRLDGEIIFAMILGEKIDSAYNKTIDLMPGLYYIGYFNATSGQPINCSIYREVSQYNQNYMIPDPAPGPCGTEVTMNGGGHGINTVTQGFTRLIYFAGGAPIQTISRLDYYWYSSNPSVLAVTDYGTVLGLSVTQDTSVKIMAVCKYDPSIVFVMDFTVLKETKKLSSDPVIIFVEMTVTADPISNYINLSSAIVPINLLQHYVWSSYDSIYIDNWGRFTVPANSSGQTFTFKGDYKLNPTVIIIVSVLVE